MYGEIRLARAMPFGPGQQAKNLAFAINFQEVANGQWSVSASGGPAGAESSTTVKELLDVRKAKSTIAYLLSEAVNIGFSVTKIVIPSKEDDTTVTLVGVQAEEASLKIAKDWMQ